MLVRAHVGGVSPPYVSMTCPAGQLQAVHVPGLRSPPQFAKYCPDGHDCASAEQGHQAAPLSLPLLLSRYHFHLLFYLSLPSSSPPPNPSSPPLCSFRSLSQLRITPDMGQGLTLPVCERDIVRDRERQRERMCS